MKKCIIVIIAVLFCFLDANMLFATPTPGHRRPISGGQNGNGAVGFSIGSKGYIGTGMGLVGKTKTSGSTIPAANTWTQKANFGGGARRGSRRFLHREQGLHRDWMG